MPCGKIAQRLQRIVHEYAGARRQLILFQIPLPIHDAGVRTRRDRL